MNILSLLRDKLQKQQRLEEAQLLFLKAYRGIPYTEATVDCPRQPTSLRYRGQSYVG